ncbi:hypothetical protein [Kitasatospora sp. NPDC018619]|uniref:hypothetical protein n=1 Tax=unclassified Kitasatospora TaxID=2633591 RepID=UPI00379377E6
MDWELVQELAADIGREIGRRWPVVDADDVSQEILTHVVENQARLTGKERGYLATVFRSIGQRYASRERDYQNLVDDQYWYTPKEVRALVRSFGLDNDQLAQMLGKKDDLQHCRVTDNLVPGRCDVMEGMKCISPRYREVVWNHLVDDQEVMDSKLLTRAVDALTTAMNRNIRKQEQTA